MHPPLIRLATAADVPAIAGVLRECAAAPAVSQLYHLIDTAFLVANYNESTIAPLVERNELLVGQFGVEVGAVAYQNWEDAVVWADRPAGEALYLIRVEVLPLCKGQGFPEALVQYAKASAAAAGKKFVRFNCPPRRGLQQIYERLGFVQLDKKSSDAGTVVRMELALHHG